MDGKLIAVAVRNALTSRNDARIVDVNGVFLKSWEREAEERARTIRNHETIT